MSESSLQFASSFALPSSRSRRRAKRVINKVVTLLLILMSAVAGSLASELGRVEGHVTDPSGGRIVRARVTLRDNAGVIRYETRTDDEGKFSVPNVADGSYRVTAELQGFTQPGDVRVDVTGGSTKAVELRLDVAAISDQLVITATRTPTATSETGGSVNVIASENLLRGNQIQISETLRTVPGISVAQTGGRGGLTSVFTRGGESDYNKVLIDGVPVNRAGGAFDFGFLTAENIERVEIVRGPQSAPFGSDAVTSTIQLITKRGSTEIPEFEFSGEGGSFDSHRETARLSGLARWFDYSGSFGFLSTDGRVRNSDYINRSASTNLGFRLMPSAELRVTSRWNNSTLGVAGPTAILFSDPDARQKHRDLALAGSLNLTTTSRFNQQARFIYSELDTNNFDPIAQDLTDPLTPPLPPFAFGADFASTFKDHQKRIGVHYQGVVAINTRNLLTAGMDFEHESGVFDSSSDFSRSRVSPTRTNVGFYVEDQAAWRDRVFLTAALRMDHNTGDVPNDLRILLQSLGSTAPEGDVGFGFSVNPKIALSVLLRRHQENALLGATRVKASFGTGIKEPTLDESFGPSFFALGNPTLDPERNISFDVGAVQEFFGRRLSVDLTYFDNRFRDLITFESTATSEPIHLSNGQLTNYVNSDRASGRGIELSANARPSWWLSRLRLSGSYTFLRSRLDRAADIVAFLPPTFDGVLVPNPELGLPLLRRPRHSGAFEVSWIDQKFDLTLDGSLVGKRRDFIPFPFTKFDFAGNPIFADGYEKLNLSGAYHLTNSLNLFARVENLLNQDYQEVLGFPAYRLNFSAGLRIRIGGKK